MSEQASDKENADAKPESENGRTDGGKPSGTEGPPDPPPVPPDENAAPTTNIAVSPPNDPDEVGEDTIAEPPPEHIQSAEEARRGETSGTHIVWPEDAFDQKDKSPGERAGPPDPKRAGEDTDPFDIDSELDEREKKDGSAGGRPREEQPTENGWKGPASEGQTESEQLEEPVSEEDVGDGPAAAPVFGDEFEDDGFADWLPVSGINDRTAWTALAVVFLGSMLLTVGFTASHATSLDAHRLTTALEKAEERRATDTYQGWREAFLLTETDRSIAAAPDGARWRMHWVGELFGASSPGSIRNQIAKRHAYYAAVLEYRFERSGSRKAEKLANDAFSEEPSDLAVAAAVYRDLARSRTDSALERIDSYEGSESTSSELAFATLEAILHAQRSERVVEGVDIVENNSEKKSLYRRFLLARAARFQEASSATDALEALTTKLGSKNLAVAIAHARSLQRDGKHEAAAKRVRRLLDDRRSKASIFQRASLHLTLGDALLSMDEVDRAKKEFETAVHIQPGRASVHLPLIDFLLDRSKLKRAGEAIERASSAAYPTPGLQTRSSNLSFLTGKLHTALAALDKGDLSLEAPILRARIQTTIGKFEEAKETLKAVGETDPRNADARVLEIWAQVELGELEPKGAIAKLEPYLAEQENEDESDEEDGSDEKEESDKGEEAEDDGGEKDTHDGPSPLVLRTAARIHAHAGDSDAIKYAEKAVEAQPDHSFNHYLLCQINFDRRNASEALAACERARQLNAKFIPGLLTASRLKLALDQSKEARLLLDGLSPDKAYRWDVDELRMRAALQDWELESARKILEEWSDDDDAPGPRVRLMKGRLAFAEANYEKARERLKSAMEDLDDNTEARLLHAHANTRLGEDFEGAEKALREINDDPAWAAEAWLVFGELRRRQDRYSDATENLGVAERQFDDDFTSTNQRARLHAERALAWAQRSGWDHRYAGEAIEKLRELEDVTTPERDLALGLYHVQRDDADLETGVDYLHKVITVQSRRCTALLAMKNVYDDPPEEITKLANKYCVSQ